MGTKITKEASEFKTKTETEVLEFAKRLSIETGEVFTFSGHFGRITFEGFKNLSSVGIDQPGIRHMLRVHGGFVKNGKIVKPTKGFAKQQAAAEARTGSR